MTRADWRAEGRYALELAALVGFAVVQPVLDVFGRSPETFVSLGADRADVVRFGLVVTLVPIAVVAATTAATRLLGRRVRRGAQTVAVTILGVLAAAVFAGSVTAGPAALLAAIVGGTALGVGYARLAAVRTWLAVASPAPVLFLALFLFASPVASLTGSAGNEVAPAASGERETPSVVLVILDELPTLSLVDGRGRIDAELFPNLAALAERSTWYRNATTVATSTLHAVPALLTGRLVHADVPPLPPYHPDTIFDVFAPTHRVRAIESTGQLCVLARCRPRPAPSALRAAAARFAAVPSAALTPPPAPLGELIDAATDVWREQAWPFGDGSGEAIAVDARVDVRPARGDPDPVLVGFDTAPELVRPGLEALATLDDDPRPTLDVFHVPFPHQPWLLLPDGRAYDAPPIALGSEFGPWANADTAALGRVRHLLQVQYADRFVGELVERLEELERLDDTILVVTADHGISFDAGVSLRTAEGANGIELAWVPLLVHQPGQTAGRVVDDNVLSIDVLPTLAELVGVELPFPVDGESLVDGVQRDPSRKPVFESKLPGFVELDAEAGLDAIRQAPAAGSGTGPARVWRAGRLGHLVGERVARLARGAPSRMRGTVDLEGVGAAIRAGEQPLPLYLTVRIDEGGGQESDVVAVIDGTVVGWAPVFVYPSSSEAQMLLAEPLVRDSTGEIEVYEVTGPADRPVLHRVAVRAEPRG